MNNFDWTRFARKIAVKASMEQLYNAWTKSSEIEKWFLSKADFKDEDGAVLHADSSVKKGCSYAWNWYLYDVTEHGHITDSNGIDFLQFTFAGNCLVDIHLSVQDDYTTVELTQKNIPTDDDSKKGIRLGCDRGWSFYLVNLKSVYEGGLDLRNKNAALKGMLNN